MPWYSASDVLPAELDSSSNRLAHHLIKSGAGPETTVGICLDRSPGNARRFAGGPESRGSLRTPRSFLPEDRIGAVIEDSSPLLILTQEDIAPRLRAVSCRLVCLDQAREAIMSGSTQKPESKVSPQSLAYLIFTSGSTGRPKGVEITHQSVVNLLSSMAHRPGLAPQDILLAVTTLSFDIAVLELFLPLIVGARVVIAPREDVADGNRLLALLAKSGASVVQATPATWRLLLEAGWNGRSQIKVLCGGEALPRDLADALLARSSSVWNMYGPTETTVWSATSGVEPGPDPVTIGPPIANTQFLVMNESARGRSEYPASCISAATESHAATGSSRGSRRRSSSEIRSKKLKARSSTRPVIWSATCPTAGSNSWAGWIRR